MSQDSPNNEIPGSAESRPRPEPLAPGTPIPKGQELFQHIVACLDKGCAPADVKVHVASFGYPAKVAETVVDDCVQWRQRNAGVELASGDQRSGSSPGINANMLIGGVICLIGIAVTVGTFMIASSRGGTHIVAWGAILFGALQFVRGAAQAGQERRLNETLKSECKSDSRSARL